MSTNRRSFIRNVALGSGAIVSAIPENGFAANTAAMPVAAATPPVILSNIYSPMSFFKK